MFKIENNKIFLTRGDSMYITVMIYTQSGELYEPQNGDSLRFLLKSDRFTPTKTKFIDEQPLIEKNIPISDMTLRLVPQDTKQLPFGNYLYDIELTFADGYVDTFINCEHFYLLPEAG